MKGYDHDVSSWLMLENYKKVTNNCTIIDFEVIVVRNVEGRRRDVGRSRDGCLYVMSIERQCQSNVACWID